MKVFTARKNLNCPFCKQIIAKGEFCIRTSFKDRLNSSRWIFNFYHEECCKQQAYKNMTDFINNQKSLIKVKKEERIKAKKANGRPRKYSNTDKARNYKALMVYYEKRGNKEQVEINRQKLDDLTIGGKEYSTLLVV